MNGSKAWLKSQVPWTIPEQSFDPVEPGHPTVSFYLLTSICQEKALEANNE